MMLLRICNRIKKSKLNYLVYFVYFVITMGLIFDITAPILQVLQCQSLPSFCSKNPTIEAKFKSLKITCQVVIILHALGCFFVQGILLCLGGLLFRARSMVKECRANDEYGEHDEDSIRIPSSCESPSYLPIPPGTISSLVITFGATITSLVLLRERRLYRFLLVSLRSRFLILLV